MKTDFLYIIRDETRKSIYLLSRILRIEFTFPVYINCIGVDSICFNYSAVKIFYGIHV